MIRRTLCGYHDNSVNMNYKHYYILHCNSQESYLWLMFEQYSFDWRVSQSNSQTWRDRMRGQHRLFSTSFHHLTPWKTSAGLTSPASNYPEQVLWPHGVVREAPLYGKHQSAEVPEKPMTSQVPGKDPSSLWYLIFSLLLFELFFLCVHSWNFSWLEGKHRWP